MFFLAASAAAAAEATAAAALDACLGSFAGVMENVKLVRHSTPQVLAKALIILHQSGPPPTSPNPFSNFYRFSYFYIFSPHQHPPSPPPVSYFLKESAPRTFRFELSVAS